MNLADHLQRLGSDGADSDFVRLMKTHQALMKMNHENERLKRVIEDQAASIRELSERINREET